MDFPADRARGARKKFFTPNPVKLWLDAWCLPCLQDAMENSTLKLMFVYLLSLPTKLHAEQCAQAYDCFPFELLCEFALLVLTCAMPVWSLVPALPTNLHGEHCTHTITELEGSKVSSTIRPPTGAHCFRFSQPGALCKAPTTSFHQNFVL